MVALLADIPRDMCPPQPSLRPLGYRLPHNRSRRRPSPAVLRRRRLVASALVMLLLVAAWFGLQAALGRIGGSPLAITGAPGGAQPAAIRIWIVRPGDTLWSIAEAVDPRGDVRPLVDRLAAEVGGTVLHPGESVGIPTG